MILVEWTGAAKDKIAALQKAGAIVSDSPAQIGPLMLRVRVYALLINCLYATQAMKAVGLA